MKIIIDNDFNYVIYLNSFYVNKLDFNNKDALEKYFKNLFFKLKDLYNFDIIGFYNIIVYIDKYYGIILKIIKDDLDYLDYFGSKIDMQINIKDNINFLYKIIDIFNFDKNLIKYGKIYKYENNFYLKLEKQINNIEFGKLLENSIIIYEEFTSKFKEIIYEKECRCFGWET